MAQVTVIIPTYNAERFLALTIESVRAQTRTDWELVVIDDGSTDGTVALAETFAAKDARIRVRPYPNGGVVAARNRGFAESRPDVPYLAYLDHDDLWEPEFLATLIPVLDANPQAVGVHGVAKYIDSQGQPCEFQGGMVWPRQRLGVVGRRIAPIADNIPTSFTIVAIFNCIATPGQAVLRREAVEKAGLFQPDMNPCDDWDLYLRITRLGNMIFVNKIVMGWRQHETNVSRDQDRMRRTSHYLRQKLMERPDLTAEEKQTVLIGYRYTERLAASIWFKSACDRFTERRFARAANHTRFALRSYLRALIGQSYKTAEPK